MAQRARRCKRWIRAGRAADTRPRAAGSACTIPSTKLQARLRPAGMPVLLQRIRHERIYRACSHFAELGIAGDCCETLFQIDLASKPWSQEKRRANLAASGKFHFVALWRQCSDLSVQNLRTARYSNLPKDRREAALNNVALALLPGGAVIIAPPAPAPPRRGALALCPISPSSR